MKRLVATCLLTLTFALLVTHGHASVEIQAWIDESLYVTFSFEKINSTIYEEIKQQQLLFNETSIPQIIMNGLKQRKLTHVEFYTTELNFDDSSKSIRGAFYLSGSDVLSFTFNRTTMAKIYTVRTDWRNFHVNLTRALSLNFTEYFGKPLEQWQRINYTDFENRMHPAYHYNYTEPAPFEPRCYFILPTTATNPRAVADTVIFELPPSTEDNLLNSPFIILGTLIVVNIALVLYRKMRK